MADDLRDEFLRNAVRAYLRDKNVKLWMSPYVQENGETNVNVMEALALDYATQLKLEKRDCLEALLSLQDNAIKRMKEQEQFRAGGVATLHIRFSGFGNLSNESLPSTSKTVDDKTNSKSVAEVEISLNATGKELETAVSEISGKPADQIKLVFSGRVIKKDICLKDQGLKSSSRIMAIALSTESHEVEEDLMYEKLCEKTRSAASTLSKGSNEYASLELENQVGNSLKLDPKEKEALCLALALHERGRSSLKRGHHSLALLFFLEADREFGQCNSALLKSVDNVALLQLDIVWCYLCLRSMSHIPDADHRLGMCEVSLERSYGRNMERVAALKGTAGNEAALLMRLHLLQAIVAFHLHKIDRARELINKAEVELKMLKVNTDDITQIVALGYTTSEALLGLRACQGNLEAAVSKICEWQEERKQAKEQNRKERAKEKERRKLGKTADGSQYIEPDCVSTLCGMGYNRYLAISALKHSNNNMTQAVHLLQEQPHLLDAEKPSVPVTAENITQIAAMGFDIDIARLALRKHNGSIEDAVSDLVTNGGIITVNPDKLLPEEDSNSSSSNSDSSAQTSTANDNEFESERKRMKQMEAAYELENDISTEQNDHLCITLEEEETFLQEYKTLLNL
ncbi:NEDD8 ultimate buster 1-like [Frankliniella occidentalis]|uniref:NEDD8 ultimate buster 1-like n=1 Tax=Frankliniella occidentalis TaxID=133901 RepID=A0A6J1S3K1_FRAOC|nr:NEDD8 ultimate buster 1-like [Frankliniella occidentalis]